MKEKGEIQKATDEGVLLMSHMQIMVNIIEQETGHALLQFNRDKLEALKRIKAIIVVGPSGAGKSTFVDVAREWVNSSEGRQSNFVVPKRVVSRGQRANDNLEENDFASTPKEFEQKTKGGIRWQRKMDLHPHGRIEQYGFAEVPQTSIPIYSANLALLSPDAHVTGVTPDFFDHALVVYVDALPHVRSDRLVTRSPDIIAKKPEEAAMRLAGDKDNVFKQAHIRLRTRSLQKERPLSEDTMHLILRSIAEIKQAA